MSKVPDKVIFGIDEIGNSIDYGFVRRVKDDNELINLLYLRLKVFFIDQVQSLKKSNSAFPLTIMTSIGIETLGQIFINEKKGDTSFQFVQIINRIHQSFGRKPTKKYEKKLAEIWSEKDLKNLDSFGKISYRFFRNTMIHGYQGRGVFLSYEDTTDIVIDEELAYIKINPNWFWDSFKDYYVKQFEHIKRAQTNNHERQNCINYIKNFLLG